MAEANEFAEWLHDSLKGRPNRFLVLKSGTKENGRPVIDDSRVSKWLSGTQRPSMDNVLLVAKILGRPESEALIAAGYAYGHSLRSAERIRDTNEQRRTPDHEEPEAPPRLSAVRIEGADLTISDFSAEIEALQEWLSMPEDDRGIPPIEPLLMWSQEQLLEALEAKHRDERTILDYIVNNLGVSTNDPRLAALAKRTKEIDSMFADGDVVAFSQLKGSGARRAWMSEPATRTESSVAALEGEEPIERGQGHDEHP